ncbi:hypothetical protein EST38_g12763, partial [Candolleomyces aberdarensis]
LTSDGESRRGSAMTILTCKQKLSPDLEIYQLLSGLPFMNLLVGDDDLIADKDWKHIFKWFRNLLLREHEIVVFGTRITPLIIKAHLQADNFGADHIRALLNPEDKQDIKLAFDLLRAIWTLSRTTANSNPGFIKAREALWTFGKFLYHTVIPYLCVDLSLSEQLEHLSASAHLAMLFYEIDGMECLPTLLYVDLMIMIKNIFFCVAKAKVDNPEGSFWIILLGTDRLEENFGDLRTMVGNAANLDVLQLLWRLSGTTEVLPDASDHIKPQFWRADLKVKNVSLLVSWLDGRHTVEKDVPRAADVFAKLKSSLSTAKPIDILSPKGALLIDIALQDDDDDSQNESESRSAMPNEFSEIEAQVEIEDMLDVDAASSAEGNSTNAIEKTIEVKGKPMLKSRALAMYSKYRTFTTSTDRLKRVQHVGRYTSQSSTSEHPSSHLADIESGEGVIVVHDPVATVLCCESQIWLCIGEVNAICIDGRTVEEISLHLLVEDTVTISFQLLGLRRSTSVEDTSGQYDWRTHSIPEITFTVPGRFIETVNPVIAMAPSQPSTVFYLLDSAFLIALSAGLVARLSLADLKKTPKIALSKEFPYKDLDGKLCFLCEDKRDFKDIGGANIIECEFCDPAPTLDAAQGQRVLEHMAVHILFDPKVKASDEPCGLCLRPSPICRFYLKKGKGSQAFGGVRCARLRAPVPSSSTIPFVLPCQTPV